MNKFIKQLLISLSLVAILILPFLVFAGNPAEQPLKELGEAGGYNISVADSQTLFAEILGTVVQIFLSLLGIIFIGLMIYAGYNWMIARGEEEKVTRAKDTIRRAIIGLIIVVSAYAFWNFIFRKLIYGV